MTSEKWGITHLRPDLVVTDSSGRPSIWDVKWKRLGDVGPELGDLQQILAYAKLWNSPRVGLIYPGYSTRQSRIQNPDSGLSIRVLQLRLVGSLAALERGERRLVRMITGDSNSIA